MADEKTEEHYFSEIRLSRPRTEEQKAEEGQAIIRLAAWQGTLEYQHRREIRALRIRSHRALRLRVAILSLLESLNSSLEVGGFNNAGVCGDKAHDVHGLAESERTPHTGRQ